MIQIIAGTDRPNSRTLQIANLVQNLYNEQNIQNELIDLAKFSPNDLFGGNYFKGATGSLKTAVDKVTAAEGLVLVVPEYNGSYPGILKLFIDYWKYPESFAARPVCLIGLGTRWGGLRPVEHLQQALGYRDAYILPHRVFLTNIQTALQDGVLLDPSLLELLNKQVIEFQKFIVGLKNQGLDANSRSLRGK